jgi:hypothetical protein
MSSDENPTIDRLEAIETAAEVLVDYFERLHPERRRAVEHGLTVKLLALKEATDG